MVWGKRKRWWLAGAAVLVLPVAAWAATHSAEPAAQTARATPRPSVLAQAVPPSPTPLPTPPPTPAPTPLPATPATTPKPAPAVKPAPAAAATSEIADEAACPGQNNSAAAAAALTCLASYARTFHSLAAVGASGPLMTASTAKLNDMISCGYSHTACGRAFDYWPGQSGFAGRCTAENIAQGQTTPRQVFITWMNSAGHRQNILNPSYRSIGIATGGANLWVMQLGGC